jgi:hypothetical protein
MEVRFISYENMRSLLCSLCVCFCVRVVFALCSLCVRFVFALCSLCVRFVFAFVLYHYFTITLPLLYHYMFCHETHPGKTWHVKTHPA